MGGSFAVRVRRFGCRVVLEPISLVESVDVPVARVTCVEVYQESAILQSRWVFSHSCRQINLIKVPFTDWGVRYHMGYKEQLVSANKELGVKVTQCGKNRRQRRCSGCCNGWRGRLSRGISSKYVKFNTQGLIRC